MIIAHKIAMDPNNKEATYFTKAAGTARFAYNWALAEWQRQYEAWRQNPSLPKPSQQSLRRQLNVIKRSQFPWMLEVTKCAPQMAIIQLGEAFKNFWAGRAKYPKFRKKGIHDRITLTNDQFSIDGRRIRIPNLGWVRMRESLRNGMVRGTWSGRPASDRISCSGQKKGGKAPECFPPSTQRPFSLSKETGMSVKTSKPPKSSPEFLLVRIGVDLSKDTFHVVGVDEKGHRIFRKKFTRESFKTWLGRPELPRMTVAMESCGGAQWWGSYCQAQGHVPMLIPPHQVKPFATSQKNDFNVRREKSLAGAVL